MTWMIKSRQINPIYHKIVATYKFAQIAEDL